MMSPISLWLANTSGLKAELGQESLAAYQMTKLRKLLSYVKQRSSYYGKSLEDIVPENIVTWEDIQILPFITDRDLRLQGQNMVCVSQRDIARIISLETSGTSGMPKRIFYADEDLESCVDFFAHGMQSLVQSGDRVAVFFPGAGPGGVVDLLGKGLERIGCSLVHCAETGLSCPPQVECFVGLASHLYKLAKLYPHLRPKTVLLCADSIPEAVRTTIETLWATEVFTHYGSTESGLGGGVECWAHAGYHMRDADLLWEIVDPQTGDPMPPGVQGELVITTLTRSAMPLIRYRTGDYGSILAGPCPCGSPLHRLGSGKGRLDSDITMEGGYATSLRDLDEMLYAFPDLLGYEVYVDVAAEKIRLAITLLPQAAKAGFAETVIEKLRLPVALEVEIIPHAPQKIGLKRKVHHVSF